MKNSGPRELVKSSCSSRQREWDWLLVLMWQMTTICNSIPGDMKSSSDFCRHQVCMTQTHTCRQITNTHRMKTNTFLSKRRDGSVIQSMFCSPRGPNFRFQHPHGSSSMSVSPCSGDQMPSSDFHVYLHSYSVLLYMQTTTHKHKKQVISLLRSQKLGTERQLSQ